MARISNMLSSLQTMFKVSCFYQKVHNFCNAVPTIQECEHHMHCTEQWQIQEKGQGRGSQINVNMKMISV